ncbi:MAG: hypothetical protein PWP52_2140 [Bacteroidales bacterium]|nr:hypothetical protein [Bacteroidales bacterium]
MIYIKRIFPGNNYLLRRVKILTNGETIAKIGHNEVIELPEREGILRFKIDFYQTKLKISPDGKDIFLLLYFDIRNYFPFNFIDFFKNSLSVKQVDEEEFGKITSEKLYQTKPSKQLKFDTAKVFSTGISFLIAGLFILTPFLYAKSEMNNFAFFIGLLSMFGIFNIIFSRNKISEEQYKIRVIAFVILSLILLIYLNLNIEIKVIAIVLSIINVLLTLKREFEKMLHILKIKIKSP